MNQEFIKKFVAELDCELYEAELAIERTKFECERLSECVNDPKSDAIKLYEWDSNRIRTDLVFDYVVKVDKKIAAIALLFNDFRECLKKNGEEDKENTETNESKKKVYDMINRLDSAESLRRVYELAQYLYLREDTENGKE